MAHMYVCRAMPTPPPPERVLSGVTYDLLNRWWKGERNEDGAEIYLDETDIPYLDGMRFASKEADTKSDLFHIVKLIQTLKQVEIAWLWEKKTEVTPDGVE